jgi:NAD(P) transhydrogenase subunit beta
MNEGIITACYILASILFILSLGGLSDQEKARRGNIYGIIGMILAITATLFAASVGNYGIIITMMVIGAILGALLAARVKMTAMPELVAMLHSFVGLAAVLVGFATFLDTSHAFDTPAEKSIHDVEIFLGILIGAVTFTGSVVAFGKLSGKIGGRPLTLPGRHLLNLLILFGCIYLGYNFIQTGSQTSLIIMTVLALLFGIHMVAAIGGADMPVVISMLNSYSGWAAAATGFMLSNDLLIVTGALVGSSGAILSIISFPKDVAPGEVPQSVLTNLVFIYVPIVIAFYSGAVYMLSRYKITRAGHAENLRAVEALGKSHPPKDQLPH